MKAIMSLGVGVGLMVALAPVYAEQELVLGATAQYEQSIYKDGKARLNISPLRISSDGYYSAGPALNLFKGINKRAYVGAGLDEWDHKRGKSDITQGMESLDRAVNVKLGTAWKARRGVVNIEVLHDVAGAHEGNQIKLRYIKPLRRAQVTWLPYGAVTWMDKDVSNYYFGVKDSEATASRPSYNAQSTAVLKAGVDVYYAFEPRWYVVGGLGVAHYGNSIGDSPLVERQTAAYTTVGLAYQFK